MKWLFLVFRCWSEGWKVSQMWPWSREIYTYLTGYCKDVYSVVCWHILIYCGDYAVKLFCFFLLSNCICSSQAVEVKNDKVNNAVLSVMIGGKKLVIGILTQKTTHILFDLVFEKEFELSHNGKYPVHVCGYTCFIKEGKGNHLSKCGSFFHLLVSF